MNAAPRPARCRTLLLLALLPAAARPAAAQAVPPGDRVLATRAELGALAADLERAGDAAALAPVRRRLEEGDFRAGDRILLTVRGESTLTDTFVVGPALELALPSPVVGTLSLHGTLRAELQERLAQWVGRFVQQPVVRAQPMVRLSVQGEVVRAGVYTVPADAPLADVMMAAGGFTREANVGKVRIERDGRRLREGKLQALLAGRTVDEADLRDGDQVVIARRGAGVSESLRSAWFLVSIAGGLFALSRVL